MKLSAKTRYGTRALLDLAIHQKGSLPIPLKDIAERQEISLNYLEHIVGPLITSGIVSSSRGIKGGIYLARSALDITLKEVVEVLEGSTALVECITRPQVCSRSGSCATQDVWSDISKAIEQVLVSTTLQDLVERQKNKVSATGMYFI
jgi:Rrf2 family transcriptional regulator, cysteine metabolism repressor